MDSKKTKAGREALAGGVEASAGGLTALAGGGCPGFGEVLTFTG